MMQRLLKLPPPLPIADNALLFIFIQDGRPGAALNVSDGDVLFLAEDIDNAILSEDTTACSANGYSLGWFGKEAC
jgi:hypothetical protein